MAGRSGTCRALLVAGVLLAAGSRNLTRSYSSDLGLYEHYATAALASPVFHALPREYPALALGVFVVPLAVPLTYSLGFSASCRRWSCARPFERRARRVPGVVTPYLLLPAHGDRYCCLRPLRRLPGLGGRARCGRGRRGNWGRAWAWAVVGGMLKLFPFLLLPGFLIVERSQTGKWALRRAVAACVPVTLITVGQLAASPSSVLSPLRYQFRRGFELSSLQGSVSFLSGSAACSLDQRVWLDRGRRPGPRSHIGRGYCCHGQCFVDGLGARRPGTAIRRRRQSCRSFYCGTEEKSFAPQYLIWLAPFWAYWPMRRGWVAVALLTTLIYPLLYGEAADSDQAFIYQRR